MILVLPYALPRAFRLLEDLTIDDPPSSNDDTTPLKRRKMRPAVFEMSSDEQRSRPAKRRRRTSVTASSPPESNGNDSDFDDDLSPTYKKVDGTVAENCMRTKNSARSRGASSMVLLWGTCAVPSRLILTTSSRQRWCTTYTRRRPVGQSPEVASNMDLSFLWGRELCGSEPYHIGRSLNPRHSHPSLYEQAAYQGGHEARTR
jgi:hypothetical protein